MEEKRYWENFGYQIAGPVVYSFVFWLFSEISTDKSITDVIFVARDGYLPYKFFKKLIGENSEYNIQYIYASRSVIMTDSNPELFQYQEYINSKNLNTGKIAIVDSITDRFSAQTLIGGLAENLTCGFYWTVTANAVVRAAKENICFKTFKKNHESDVPCWPLIEFILSSPEAPVRSIHNGSPIYYKGNKFEHIRSKIFKYIEKGADQFFNCNKSADKSASDYTYTSVLEKLNKFYYYPTGNDKLFFSRVKVSTFPDHSDDYPVSFFATAEQYNKDRKPFPIGARLKRIYNSFRYRVVSRTKRLIRWSNTYKFSPKSLAVKLSKYNIVSFDLFDTMVFRIYDDPHDVFFKLENKNGLYDFGNTRCLAEKLCNTFHPEYNEQPDIFEIYEILSHFYGEKISAKDIDLELEEEIKSCYSNPYIKEVYDLLLSLNKNIRIIVTSDMYLPSEYLKKILISCGYQQLDGIFVSCEFRAGKINGNLQKEVTRVLGDDKTYIHVGDTYLNDYQMSRSNGWKAVYIPKSEYRIRSRQNRARRTGRTLNC